MSPIPAIPAPHNAAPNYIMPPSPPPSPKGGLDDDDDRTCDRTARAAPPSPACNSGTRGTAQLHVEWNTPSRRSLSESYVAGADATEVEGGWTPPAMPPALRCHVSSRRDSSPEARVGRGEGRKRVGTIFISCAERRSARNRPRLGHEDERHDERTDDLPRRRRGVSSAEKTPRDSQGRNPSTRRNALDSAHRSRGFGRDRNPFVN